MIPIIIASFISPTDDTPCTSEEKPMIHRLHHTFSFNTCWRRPKLKADVCFKCSLSIRSLLITLQNVVSRDSPKTSPTRTGFQIYKNPMSPGLSLLLHHENKSPLIHANPKKVACRQVLVHFRSNSSPTSVSPCFLASLTRKKPILDKVENGAV
jgi:hypothetical protein